MSTAGKKTRRIFDQRFELIGELGRGKKSVVYHALHDGKDGADVALKVLLPVKTLDPLKNRLRAEAQAMLMAQHPYVLGLKDFQYYENLSYIALEYAPLGDLRKYARANGGKLPSNQVELFLRQISEALHFIHSLGLIHRDVKPDNILAISPEEVRLADFGVALILENPGISADLNAAIGTMDYLAPEVLDGKEYGPQGDIYSLGITVYELISGLHPFADLPLANTMEARLKGPQPLEDLVPELSPNIAQTVGRMLESDPAKRFKKASEIIDSLNSPPAKKALRSKNATFFKDDDADKNTGSQLDLSGSDKQSLVTGAENKFATPSSKVDTSNALTAYSPEPTSQEEPLQLNIEPLQPLPSAPHADEALDSEDEGQPSLKRQAQEAKVKSARDSIINSAIWGHNTATDDDYNDIRDQIDSEEQNNNSLGLIPSTLRAPKAPAEQKMDEENSVSLPTMLRGQRKLTEASKSKERRKKPISNQNVLDEMENQDSSNESETFLKTSDLNTQTSHTRRLPLTRLKSKLFRILIVASIAFAAVGGYKAFFSHSPNIGSTIHLKPEAKAPIKVSSHDEDTGEQQVAHISQLKQGIYRGSLTGILTNTPLPLFLDVKETGIFVFLGVQGWTPVRADIIDKDMIEVSSNGLVLSLKITGKDFGGTVQDLLSGETGTWSIQRQVTNN